LHNNKKVLTLYGGKVATKLKISIMKNTNEKIHEFLNKNTKAVSVENVYKPKPKQL